MQTLGAAARACHQCLAQGCCADHGHEQWAAGAAAGIVAGEKTDGIAPGSGRTRETGLEATANETRLRVVEITWQSVTGAFHVSSLVAGSYPYIVLKLGMGPNVSVVSAVLGAVFLNITSYRTHGRNRYLNNVIQTAGTSASSTAFMCVIAAAFGYLDKN